MCAAIVSHAWGTSAVLGRSHTRRRGVRLARTLVLALLGAWGCERTVAPSPPGAPSTPTPPAAVAPVAHPTGAAPIAGAPAAEPAKKPRARTTRKFADALLLSIRKRFEGEGAADDDTRRALEVAAGKAKRFRKLLASAYGLRDYSRWLGRGDALSPEGRAVVDLLLDIESHGVEPSPYPTARLTKSLADYEAASAQLAAALDADPQGAVARLGAILTAFEPADGETYSDQRKRVAADLLEKGFSDDDPFDVWLADLDARVTSASAARKALRASLVDLDVAAVQGFMQYALDFKYLIVAHPFDAPGPEAAGRGADKFKKELLADFQAAGEKPAAALKAMWPRHPFYERARGALAKYRALDIAPLKLRGALKKGMKGPKVIELRHRLAAQGFLEPTAEGDVLSEVFDVALDEAVKRFQKHHQLRVDGVVKDAHGVEGAVKRKLNEPMKDRVRQLSLSLQRWRESNVTRRGHDFYFRVNIPQFEVEVWDGADQVRKHRVVVGNNKMEVDADHGRKGHLNRTALLSSTITTVVLNPVWNVPERIRIQEVLVEAAKDPTYLERHGYKRRVLNDGRELIFQEAGPDNALGQVKLLFPNEFAIYMHDTPKKSLFDRTLRAFSHGCMRLHDPVGMATYLLERDGIVNRAKVQEILKAKKERAFKLKAPIPVHVEYNTVAFDADNPEPIFLNDVYGYDQAFYEGALPVQREEAIPIVKSEVPMIEWERTDDPRDGDESEIPAPAPSFDPDEKEPPAKEEKPERDEEEPPTQDP